MKKNINRSLIYTTIIAIELIVIICIINILKTDFIKGKHIYKNPKTNEKFISYSDNNIYIEHQDIEITLDKVAEDLQNRVDVNSDNLINCIDAAVLFYKHYPNKNEVMIYLNYNPPKMNHLFNMVLVEGVWKAVEPQTNFTNDKSYWVYDVWGKYYDSSKNEDATKDYMKFVK